MRVLGVVAFFMGVLLLVLGGDYYEQRKSAEGGLGLGTYVTQLDDRLVSLASGEAFRKKKPREFMPEAPEGWLRREWAVDDSERLYGKREISETEQELMDEIEGHAVTNAMMKLDKAKGLKRRKDVSVVYDRRGEMIVMSARKEKPSKLNKRSQAAMNMVAASLNAMNKDRAFAVVQGVIWVEETGLFDQFEWDSKEDEAEKEKRARRFSARFGPYELLVEALTDDETVRQFISAIDVDGLNGELREPVFGIGSAAPQLTPDQEMAIGELHVEGAEDAAIARARHAQKEMIEAFQPTQLEKLVVGLIGGSVEEAEHTAAKPKSDQTSNTYQQFKAMKPVLKELNKMGMSAQDLIIVYDGRAAQTDLDMSVYRAGYMTDRNPAYETVKHADQHGVDPTTCIEVLQEGPFVGRRRSGCARSLTARCSKPTCTKD